MGMEYYFYHVIKFIGMFEVDFYGKSRETSHAWILWVMEGTNRKFRESYLFSEHCVFVPHIFLLGIGTMGVPKDIGQHSVST